MHLMSGHRTDVGHDDLAVCQISRKEAKKSTSMSRLVESLPGSAVKDGSVRNGKMGNAQSLDRTRPYFGSSIECHLDLRRHVSHRRHNLFSEELSI